MTVIDMKKHALAVAERSQRKPKLQVVSVSELFHSPHAALVFAFNFSGQQYAPSALAKQMGGEIGSGKGLVGVDGAGQAGMILREIDGLGEPAKHFIAARYAPHVTVCPACEQKTRLVETWAEATAWIAERAQTVLKGRTANYHLRIGIVRRFFGERITMSDLAEKAGVKRDTASEHNSIVMEWMKREQDKALNAAETALKQAGLC